MPSVRQALLRHALGTAVDRMIRPMPQESTGIGPKYFGPRRVHRLALIGVMKSRSRHSHRWNEVLNALWLSGNVRGSSVNLAFAREKDNLEARSIVELWVGKGRIGYQIRIFGNTGIWQTTEGGEIA